MTWRDALLKLHGSGWDPRDIDAGCEALREACEDGRLEPDRPSDLSAEEVALVLGQKLVDPELSALLQIAELYDQGNTEASDLRDALHDLEAFVSESAAAD